MSVHIPEYIGKNKLEISVNGEKADYEIKLGYAYINREWEAGDVLEIKFPMEAKRIYGSLKSVDMAGCTALMRGPFVYCIEETDNGATLQALKISRQSEIKETWEKEGILKGTVTLTVQGERESVSDELYSFDAPKTTPVTVKAVPYYIWGNRGKGQMRVWIRE